MQRSLKAGIPLLVIAAIVAALVAACGGDGEEKTSTPTATTPTEKPAEKTTITIGNLTDKTGAASVAMVVVDTALQDIIQWSNDTGYIPGIQLKAVSYDGQYDPSRDVPGYEWLKEKGANVFLTGLPNTPVSLESRINGEKAILVCMNLDDAQAKPDGRLFSINMSIGGIVKTAMKWIADNDWDWKTKGPAKIGIVAWDTTYFNYQEKAIKEYCDAHPEQFTFGGAHYIASGFKWDVQVQATKDFDYIFPPGAPLVSFIRQYYDEGGKAKLVMCDTHISFFGLIGDGKLWPKVDGSLVFLPSPWWNEDAKVVNMAKDFLLKSGGEAALKKAMEREHGFLTSTHQFYGFLEMIRQTVERVGPENFSAQAMYETLTSGFTTQYGDEYAPWGYVPSTDRFGYDWQLAYRINGATGELIKADPNWLPVPAE